MMACTAPASCLHSSCAHTASRTRPFSGAAACRAVPLVAQARLHISQKRTRSRYQLLTTCATATDQDPKQTDPKNDDKVSKKTEKVMAELKKGGIDQGTARKILEVWKETGGDSPEQLRKMLQRRSLTTAGGVLLQLLLDIGASLGAYSSGNAFGAGPDFFGKIVVVYGAFFLGSYFAVGALFDVFTLVLVASSAFQYSTNTDAFMAAIREIAGPNTGLNVVEKAKMTVNAAKVASALNNISEMLRQRMGTPAKVDTLRNLSAYLTLSKAEESGFRPEDYKLSEKEAGELAVQFTKYDLNGDMRLEESELRRLWTEYNIDMDGNEFKAAVKLLDKDGNGTIEFSEFVDWYCNEIKPTSSQIEI